mgnify:CR=1 FL=1
MVRLMSRGRIGRTVSAFTVVATVLLAVTPAGAAPKAQAALTVSNTSLQVKIGATVKVTTSGGSGSGAVKFSVTGANCSINATTGSLTTRVAATCVVKAIKAASGPYAATTSAAVTFKFVKTPFNLLISNSSHAGQVGVPLTVTVSGSADTGAVTFATTGSVCSIDPQSGLLIADAAGSCPVTVSQAAGAGHDAATSAVVTFTFGPGPQLPLVIGNDPLTGVVGTPTTVFTTGGSGSGAVTYAVTGANCSIAATTGVLSATADGATCTVTATKAATASYLVATSAPAIFTFSATGSGGGGGASQPQARLTQVSGGVGVLLDDTVDGKKLFLDKYFNPSDGWKFYYFLPGATVSLTWTVTDAHGVPMANQAVTLQSNLAWSCAVGVNWSVSSLNSNPGCDMKVPQGNMSGTTDNDGVVTFTFTNTDTLSGALPAGTDLTSGKKAAGYELNAQYNVGVFNWTCMLLQIGSRTYTSLSPATNQITDRVDLILIPRAV